MNNTVQNVGLKEDVDISRRRYICPSCGKHTLLWLFPDTTIKNLPVKCKRCGQEIMVNVNPFGESEDYIDLKSDTTKK